MGYGYRYRFRYRYRYRLSFRSLCLWLRLYLRFRPLVAEATGAWTRDASTVLLAVSKAVAVRTNQDIARGHRARAVLRRRAEASEHT